MPSGVPKSKGEDTTLRSFEHDTNHESEGDGSKARLDALEEEGSASMFETVMNLTNNIIGAGLLSLPWCIKESSIVYGALMVALMGFIQALTFVVVVICCEYAGTFSFMELGRRVMGSLAGSLIQICMLVYTAGSCLSFIVLTGDFISSDTGFAHELCGDDCILTSRPFAVFVVTISFLAPLCSLQDLRALWFTSMLSVASMFYLLGLTLWKYASSDGINPCTGKPPVIRVASASTGLFSAAPIVGVAFIAHYNAPRFYKELSNRTIPALHNACLYPFALCSSVYLLFGVFGYLTFGHETKSDLLENFASDSTLAIIARVALFLLVSSTYPRVFTRYAQALCSSTLPHSPRETQKQSSSGC